MLGPPILCHAGGADADVRICVEPNSAGAVNHWLGAEIHRTGTARGFNFDPRHLQISSSAKR